MLQVPDDACFASTWNSGLKQCGNVSHHLNGLEQWWANNLSRGPLSEGCVWRRAVPSNANWSKSRLKLARHLRLPWWVGGYFRFEDFPECFRGPPKTLQLYTCGPRSPICPPLVSNLFLDSIWIVFVLFLYIMLLELSPDTAEKSIQCRLEMRLQFYLEFFDVIG